jgi:hypothetical protein
MRTRQWTTMVLTACVVSAAAAGTTKPRAVEDDMSGKREMFMSNCPSAVDGSKTALRELDDGVELTITAREEWARREIWRRAQNQGESAWKAERGAIEHTGMGTGSGRFGFCPGILQGTTVDAELLPDGAKLTVRADDPRQAAKLKRVTRDRLEWLHRRHTPRS